MTTQTPTEGGQIYALARRRASVYISDMQTTPTASEIVSATLAAYGAKANIYPASTLGDLCNPGVQCVVGFDGNRKAGWAFGEATNNPENDAEARMIYTALKVALADAGLYIESINNCCAMVVAG